MDCLCPNSISENQKVPKLYVKELLVWARVCGFSWFSEEELGAGSWRVQPHRGLNSGILLGKTWVTKGEDEWQSRACSMVPENEVGPRMTLLVFLSRKDCNRPVWQRTGTRGSRTLRKNKAGDVNGCEEGLGDQHHLGRWEGRKWPCCILIYFLLGDNSEVVLGKRTAGL